jgi:hypothetical protein
MRQSRLKNAKSLSYNDLQKGHGENAAYADRPCQSEGAEKRRLDEKKRLASEAGGGRVENHSENGLNAPLHKQPFLCKIALC